MDEKDKQIIKILKNDSRAGYADIGKQIDLSEGAVRKRIKTLTDEGVIRKFTLKVGVAEGAQAITLLATNPAFPTVEVSKKIMEIPNVETIYEVTGEYDISRSHKRHERHRSQRMHRKNPPSRRYNENKHHDSLAELVTVKLLLCRLL